VGVIQRKSIKVGDADRYCVLYKQDISNELIALLVVLADIIWQTADSSISYLSYEYNWQIGGKKQDKNWQPGD
jgi:hypothetical protein